MGFLDEAKSAVAKQVDQHGDKIDAGTDRLGEIVDEKTGGQHADAVDRGQEKVDDLLDKLDGQDDDIS